MLGDRLSCADFALLVHTRMDYPVPLSSLRGSPTLSKSDIGGVTSIQNVSLLATSAWPEVVGSQGANRKGLDYLTTSSS